MARILIVEDEPFERFELKAEIAALYGDGQVRVAECVEDAIAVIESWKPALILLDIRLKGQSGLEVARYVRKKQLRSEIIIVTAYNEFEYAREAMSFGINHYLSKPVRPQVLLEKIEEALEKYNARAVSPSQPLWPLLEAGREKKAQDSLGSSISTVIVAGFEQAGESLEAYADFFAAKFPPERSKVELMEERIIIYLEDNPGVLAPDLGRLGDEFTRHFQHELVLGVASSGPTLAELYRQAIAACNHKIFYPGQRILHYAQVVTERKKQRDYPVTLEQKLLNLVKRGEQAQIDGLLQKMVPALLQLSEGSYPVLKTWVDGLVNALNKMCIREGLSLNGVAAFKPNSFWFSPAHLEGDLRALVRRIRAGFGERLPGEHPLIAQAVNFLLEHYQEDITLARVAQELKISPGYFSRLFKAEIGVPFKNYLTEIRMEQAKQLLCQGDHPIAEVAAAVGFPDPNYFSEAFRKYAGVSPSQYKASESKP
ncbi:MAG TPA: helix-turn-helix domain-containing protein [Capillibacterium sp.]